VAAGIPEPGQIKQLKEFLGTSNKLTETCFWDCAKDFTTTEEKRFQENHIQGNEVLAAKAVNVLMAGPLVKDCQRLLL
uniref:Mitochondrial import inner membrane translocase subunit n=1 Tax=Neovison vison TaxID=452646 RepID=A0A8C7B2R4_NEOVI